jgi:formylmethanofuran dehydrogenase subunit E-like metal-binding protein
MTPIYTGTVSQNMTLTQYQALQKKLGNDTFPIASLANAWAIGLSADILREAAFHGHVCMGTISGYAMIETLLKYYPPGAGTGGAESSGYIVIGVPGGSDDDVFVYAMDSTPGKRSYI